MTLFQTHLFPKKLAKKNFCFPILIKVFNLARKHFNFAWLGGSYLSELQLLNYINVLLWHEFENFTLPTALNDSTNPFKKFRKKRSNHL